MLAARRRICCAQSDWPFAAARGPCPRPRQTPLTRVQRRPGALRVRLGPSPGRLGRLPGHIVAGGVPARARGPPGQGRVGGRGARLYAPTRGPRARGKRLRRAASGGAPRRPGTGGDTCKRRACKRGASWARRRTDLRSMHPLPHHTPLRGVLMLWRAPGLYTARFAAVALGAWAAPVPKPRTRCCRCPGLALGVHAQWVANGRWGGCVCGTSGAAHGLQGRARRRRRRQAGTRLDESASDANYRCVAGAPPGTGVTQGGPCA